MKQVVIADTGPLIILAGIDQLSLLPAMYTQIAIPEAVHAELQLGSSHRETKTLANCFQQGWLQVVPVASSSTLEKLKQIVDSGEAEAILLAETINCRFLLIDDRKGRRVAVNRGHKVVGVAGLLLAAKQQKRIEAVTPLINQMAALGYRLSSGLCREISQLAQENPTDFV